MNGPSIIYLGNHATLLGKHVQSLAAKLGYRLRSPSLFIHSQNISLQHESADFHACGHTILNNVFSLCDHCKYNVKLLHEYLNRFVDNIKFLQHIVLVQDLYSIDTIYYYDYILDYLKAIKKSSGTSFSFGCIYLYNSLWIGNSDNFYTLYQLTQGIAYSAYILIRTFEEYLLNYSQSITIPSNTNLSSNTTTTTISNDNESISSSSTSLYSSTKITTAHIKSLLKQDAVGSSSSSSISDISQVLYQIACDLLFVLLPNDVYHQSHYDIPITTTTLALALPPGQSWDPLFYYLSNPSLYLSHWPYHICCTKRKLIDIRSSLHKTLIKYHKYFHNIQYLTHTSANVLAMGLDQLHPWRYLYSNVHTLHLSYQYAFLSSYRQLLTSYTTSSSTTTSALSSKKDVDDMIAVEEDAEEEVVSINNTPSTPLLPSTQKNTNNLASLSLSLKGKKRNGFLFDLQQFQITTNPYQVTTQDYISFVPSTYTPSSNNNNNQRIQHIQEQMKLLQWACPNIPWEYHLEEMLFQQQQQQQQKKGSSSGSIRTNSSYVPNSRLYSSNSNNNRSSRASSSASSSSSISSSSSVSSTSSTSFTSSSRQSTGTTTQQQRSRSVVSRSSSIQAQATSANTNTKTTAAAAQGVKLPISVIVYESPYSQIIIERIVSQCKVMIQCQAYKHVFTSTTASCDDDSGANGKEGEGRGKLLQATRDKHQQQQEREKSSNRVFTSPITSKQRVAALNRPQSESKAAADSTPPPTKNVIKKKTGGNHTKSHLYNDAKYITYDDLKDCILVVDDFIAEIKRSQENM